MKPEARTWLEDLIIQRPVLSGIAVSIEDAFKLIVETYRNDGQLFACGNGGSAADAEHIVGELMKEYLLKRPLSSLERTALVAAGGVHGSRLATGLCKSLRAISLVSQSTILTAVINDVGADLMFAQQMHGYGRAGDSLLAISTSGNAANVCNAVYTAKAIGVKTVGLTGAGGGALANICDVVIRVPADDTFRIQELHQPVYHCLCAMLEAEFFDE
jgi:phosphoheptose isomerase